jgi:small subunit ribosomal protein S17e
MDRVRRLSTELLTRYPDKFTHDFEQNKKIINELATIRSKVLRNTVAGYITSYLRKKSGQQEAQAESPDEEAMEPPSQEIDEKSGS